MTGRIAFLLMAAAASLGASARLAADTIQLANGDRLNGKVTSLDEKHLVFKSASFGELKIDRTKIDFIALGDKKLPEATPVAQTAQALPGANGGLLNQVAPLLQNSAVQQQVGPMIDQLLGAGGVNEMQRNVDNARRGLQDLKKDLGPDAKALDAYINMFNLLSPPSAASGPQPPNAPYHAPPPAASRSQAPPARHPSQKPTPGGQQKP